jgi:hypothetical protein
MDGLTIEMPVLMLLINFESHREGWRKGFLVEHIQSSRSD